VDELVCLKAPPDLGAIGFWYRDFAQTPDEEVIELLEKSRQEERQVKVPVGSVELEGNLGIPGGARGVVLFAHGSGSGRNSPRNRYVAGVLREAGLATLLMDLLTTDEEEADLRTGHLRFDIGLLAQRLAGATDWLTENPLTRNLRIGYFGASTGAGAALVAAAKHQEAVGAVVARRPPRPRGGRPAPRQGANPPHRRRGRRPRDRDEPGSFCADKRPEEAGDHTGGYPPLRGTGHPGRGSAAGSRVVRAPPSHRGRGRLKQRGPTVDRIRDPFFGRGAQDAAQLTNQVGEMAHPLEGPQDLDPLLERIGEARCVLLGEASHGTSEYYTWRARLSWRLIREKGFSFIAVEGDWPDCYEVNRYVKGYPDSGADAREVLGAFERWPTWMWANEEVVRLAEWLRGHNEAVAEGERIGFYGLDVYSLWESMESVIECLERVDPDAVEAAHRARR
jgi:hypothetical protein